MRRLVWWTFWMIFALVLLMIGMMIYKRSIDAVELPKAGGKEEKLSYHVRFASQDDVQIFYVDKR